MVDFCKLLYDGVAKKGCKKICKFFASELGFKLGIMRGFQKSEGERGESERGKGERREKREERMERLQN